MNRKDEKMSRKYEVESWKALEPPLPMSYQSSLENKTGSWKYIRPMYQDKVAPCQEGCPAGEDIEGYMYLISRGLIKEAWELLRKDNPLPSICGRVCFHPCEMACNRKDFDEAISINQIERLLGDYGLKHGTVPAIGKKRKEKIAIVGSGPAGLSCAYQLALMGYQVILFEALKVLGGILRIGIPAYRLPKDILEAEINLIQDMGVEMRTGVRVGKDIPLSDLGKYQAVFLSTGVHISRSMGAKGEQHKGVLSGLEFLKDLNMGKKVQLGKRVAIVGGGNTAMDAARSALRLGSEPVVVYRRTRNEMPAIEDEIHEAERENIAFKFLTVPVEVISAKGKIKEIECIEMKLGKPDESGRRRPEPIEGSNFRMKADNVITAIGEKADLSYLPEDIEVEWGKIVVDEFGRTSRKGVYAGGDAIDQPHTVADAIGAGKRAAIAIDSDVRNVPLEMKNFQVGETGSVSMEKYLDTNTLRKKDQINEIVRIEDINIEYFEKADRFAKPRRDVEDVKNNFDEVNTGFTEEILSREASRCFNCGVCNECEVCLIFCPDMAILRKGDEKGFEFKYDYCKGCGICAKECPRNAMSMTREGL
jgi:2-oxoacid:acceptor oxidoreductase delta subunit (pyruvate/2-ketoisovalerate family)